MSTLLKLWVSEKTSQLREEFIVFCGIEKTEFLQEGQALMMEYVLAFVNTNNEVITLASVGISLVSLLLWMINYWRTGKMLKKYNKIMEGMENKNLEEMLASHVKSVNKMFSKTLEIESEYKAAKKMAEKSVQKVGVVRFNAFDDTGSDLSFTVALLDSFGDGVVISSLFGRDETRTYAKPVNRGQSSYHLSVEEKEAISKAMEQKTF